MKLANPLIPGFNPDPSVVRVGEDYYVATSTFEYLPGIPVYHSRDLQNWTLAGHVVTREGQLQVKGVPTAGGAWAPTIRFHNGLFHVAVTDALGRGTMVFTAENPAGPWSDGTIIDINGIDPDLAWDADGNCYMTFSGLLLTGPEFGKHLGIQQARIDIATGARLEEPRNLWSGTGLMFPEAPHLYQIGDYWYLVIAEGGTERGHSVSIARSDSPEGPFENNPANPVLSARSTTRPVQNTGHGDLVQTVDGEWVLVMLGMRTRGMTRGFSSLGRETFASNVTWQDGWPIVEPVELNDYGTVPTFQDDFSAPTFGGDWIGARRFPAEVAELENGTAIIAGEGRSMDHAEPNFLGRRQRRLDSLTVLDVTVDGVAGLTVRYDENAHYDIEFDGKELTARARLARLNHEVKLTAPNGSSRIRLFIEMAPPAEGWEDGQTSDIIHVGFIDSDETKHQVAEFDGRYLSAEVTTSFTGRVVGAYCVTGSATLHNYSESAL